MTEEKLYFMNAYFIIGTAYAGKSTMVRELAKKHDGIACTENYHDGYPGSVSVNVFRAIWLVSSIGLWVLCSRMEHKDSKALSGHD